MLQFVRTVASPVEKTNPVTFAFGSSAYVDLGYNRKRRIMHLALHGTMIGSNAVALHKFLRVVAHLSATQWTLQMRDLEIISLRGIQYLLRFVNMLRKRGDKLEVRGIHPNVYATLRDLNLLPDLIKNRKTATTTKSHGKQEAL